MPTTEQQDTPEPNIAPELKTRVDAMTRTESDPIVPIVIALVEAIGPQAVLVAEVVLKLATTRPEYVVGLAAMAQPFSVSEMAILDDWIAANPLEVRDD